MCDAECRPCSLDGCDLCHLLGLDVVSKAIVDFSRSLIIKHPWDEVHICLVDLDRLAPYNPRFWILRNVCLCEAIDKGPLRLHYVGELFWIFRILTFRVLGFFLHGGSDLLQVNLGRDIGYIAAIQLGGSADLDLASYLPRFWHLGSRPRSTNCF